MRTLIILLLLAGCSESGGGGSAGTYAPLEAKAEAAASLGEEVAK